ncbi:LysR family transcriptional regulator [Aestuariispira insulae]|nr:LysR family transcriptional regulator [Aestuariispira insulae]
MNWRSIKFDWNRARAFLVTAEEGSLSAAARALGMVQSTLGRQVEALEAELGVTLFERAGRRLVLTRNGRDLLEHVRAMGEAAGQVSMSASGQSELIEGTIRISATETFAAKRLPPVIAKLRKFQPEITVEVCATNKAVDLNRREADIALRHFRPTQTELIARKLSDDNAFLYAAPDYLAQIGDPSTPAALGDADFIGFENNDVYLKGLKQMGVEITEGNFRLITDSHNVHWELVKAGAGIGVTMDLIGDAEPQVKRVLPDLAPVPVSTWLVTHRELNTSRRVRIVFDFLAEELS